MIERGTHKPALYFVGEIRGSTLPYGRTIQGAVAQW